jgi:glycosyltransferase involved in cell wall biosynthesis
MISTPITYIAKSKIPSRHANSVQVVNMICAFSSLTPNLDVYLPGGLSRRLMAFLGNIFHNYGHSIPTNVRIHFSKESSKNKHSFEDKVLSKLSSKQPTLAFTRSPYVAWKLIEQQRPVIFESHWFSRDAKEIPIQRFSSLVSASPGSGVVTTCPAITAAYTDAGMDASRVLTLANSVDIDAFLESPAGGMKKLFGSRVCDLPVILYTGSLGQGKGAQFLAEAASSLSNIHIAIIGGSKEEIDRLRNVHRGHTGLFLHPAVPHKDIPSILQDATALVMPYLNEGTLVPYMCPLKMFEYLATGKPILSADLPAIRTALQHNHNALLFKAGSVPALKDQIKRLLGMSEQQTQILRRNQLDTVARFSWINRAKTILDWHSNFTQNASRNHP